MEFAVLGVEMVFLVVDKKLIKRWLRTVSYCGFLAFVDESIQYLSDRSPQVIDIWFDLFGTVIGAVIGLLILISIKKKNSLQNTIQKM